MKIYRIGIRGEYARVIDEEGEVAIYPLSNFLILPLPKEMAQRLEIITERHRNCSVHKLLTAKMLSDGLFLSKLGDGES